LEENNISQMPQGHWAVIICINEIKSVGPVGWGGLRYGSGGSAVFACWSFGFGSLRGHGCLSFVITTSFKC